MDEKYTYEDIMDFTGRSRRAVREWRVKVEEIAGYTFEKESVRLNRRFSSYVYYFTSEEFEKFLAISDYLDNNKRNLKQAIITIWGDKKDREDEQLKLNVSRLIPAVNKLWKSKEFQDISIHTLQTRIANLEKRLENLEENQSKGFFSKIKNKDKR